jgi:hypothetical protein
MTSELRTPNARRKAIQAAAALAFAPLWPSLAGAAPAARGGPPVARIEPVRETFFGTTVTDPYRWMENPKDPEWEPFMRGQDAHARATLKSIPGRDVLARRVSELSAGAAVASNVQSAGGQVFYQVRPAGADSFKLAVRQGADGAERILIDPTTMKGDGGVHVSLDWWSASPDGRHVVYGLSPAGSEDSVLHVMEVATQRVLAERIAGTQYAGPSWLPDGSGFFYSRVADPAAKGNGQLLPERAAAAAPPEHRPQGRPGGDGARQGPGRAGGRERVPLCAGVRSGEFAVLLASGRRAAREPAVRGQPGRRAGRPRALVNRCAPSPTRWSTSPSTTATCTC